MSSHPFAISSLSDVGSFVGLVVAPCYPKRLLPHAGANNLQRMTRHFVVFAGGCFLCLAVAGRFRAYPPETSG